MDTLRSWLSRGRDTVSVLNPIDETRNKHDKQMAHHSTGQDPMKLKVEDDDDTNNKNQGHVSIVIDPKVAEYFKDFPEPYKTKAVTRFSSSEGPFQWDFYRKYQMYREYHSAMRGDFLEDKRDKARQLAQYDEKSQEKINSEKEQAFQTREQSALEQAIRRNIPVHKDESLSLKLFQATNLSVLGVVVLWSAFGLRRRRPKTPKLQYYMVLVGSSYICAYLNAAAICRIMDWGHFDRRVDNRDALTKQLEEVKNTFMSLYRDNSERTGGDKS